MPDTVYCKFEFANYKDSYLDDIDQETLWVDDQWIGHPNNKKDFGHLCRYLCYTFRRDNIDREKLKNSFKDAIKKLEKFAVNDVGLSANTTTNINIYGIIDSKKGIFIPQHFEYDRMIKTHQVGTIKQDDAGKLDFRFHKFSLGSIWFDGQMCVFNDKRLGNKGLMKKGRIRGYHGGHMNVYMVKDESQGLPAGTLCLVDVLYDICELHWKQTPDYVESGAKYVGIVDRQSYNKIQPLIDNLNTDKEKAVAMASDGGCIIARTFGHDKDPYESWLSPYVAVIPDPENHEDHLVGLAIDTLAHKGGEVNALINFLEGK